MFISRVVDWLMEKGFLHPSHRWRREKLLHSLEATTHMPHQQEQQSLAEGAVNDLDFPKSEPVSRDRMSKGQ